jgi:hypothetical protein
MCRFAHNGDKLVVATNKGFKIYQVSPTFELLQEREIQGGVSIIQLLGLSDED